jgi:hypothetical protein
MGRILEKFVWKPFHLWFFALTAYGILNLAKNNVSPPHAEFSYLTPFLFFWVMLSLSKRLEGSRLQGAAPFALPVLFYLPIHLILFYTSPLPLHPETIHDIFEVSGFFWFLVFLTHCLTVRGGQAVLRLFGLGLVYGIFLENVGIFAGFFSEPGYTVYLSSLPAPVFTMMGWCTAFYVSVSFAEELTSRRSRPAVRALVCTAVALSLDVMVDSAASLCKWWIWDPGLKPFFFGTPLVNFTAWASAVFPFACLYFRSERAFLDPAERTAGFLKGLPYVPLGAAALILAFTFTLEGGSRSAELFLENMKALAGFVYGHGMLAF